MSATAFPAATYRGSVFGDDNLMHAVVGETYETYDRVTGEVFDAVCWVLCAKHPRKLLMSPRDYRGNGNPVDCMTCIVMLNRRG